MCRLRLKSKRRQLTCRSRSSRPNSTPKIHTSNYTRPTWHALRSLSNSTRRKALTSVSTRCSPTTTRRLPGPSNTRTARCRRLPSATMELFVMKWPPSLLHPNRLDGASLTTTLTVCATEVVFALALSTTMATSEHKADENRKMTSLKVRNRLVTIF